MGREHRKNIGHKLSAEAMIYAIDGQAIVTCDVEDISVSGVRISLNKEAELPGHFVLATSHAGQGSSAMHARLAVLHRSRGSRPPMPSAAWRRKPPGRHTSPSICKRSRY